MQIFLKVWETIINASRKSKIIALIRSKTSEVFLNASFKSKIIASTGLAFALCTFGAVAVVPATMGTTTYSVNAVEVAIPLPDLSSQIEALQEEPRYFIREEKVRWGDTIGAVLKRMGVNDYAAVKFIKSDSTANNLLRLMTGQIFRAKVSETGDLHWLSSNISSEETYVRNVTVRRDGDTFSAEDKNVALERRIEMRSGEIRLSLFGATDAAGVPKSITRSFLNMFSTSIDFSSSLRRGDRFTLVYETYWQDGSFVRSGNILGAEFINDGCVYNAAYYEKGDEAGYYDFEGRTLKKTFLKSPVAFTRISSGFTNSRLHPVLGYRRAHRAIDYAASTGTPIHASADGVVRFVGRKGGYGKTVMLKHIRPYSTLYAHMSRFKRGVTPGKRVKQGDIIGYVGMTGTATGPHLHYELRINGRQVNPRSVEVPAAEPLSKEDLAKFRLVADQMQHRFAVVNPVANQLAAK